MKEVLKKAVEHILSDRLDNEAQVKQAVILPILRALDWDDANPAEFVPEFPVDSGRVDYALLRDGGDPLVFIEAKKLGAADGQGEEQLFGYAVNKGVPFLILTDGNVWDFYLSMAAGAPSERRFYRAELTRAERTPEYVEFLETYLRKSPVVSGQARRTAEKRHESNRESEKARKAIPRAWRTLLETPEEMLRDLLAEEVESQCGTKPELDDVEEFLKGLLSDAPPPRTPDDAPTTPRPPSPGGTRPPEPGNRSRIVGFILDNGAVETGAAIRTLVEVLKAFDRRDPGFMERFADQTAGRKRRLVARNRDDLYDRSDLVRDHSTDLENGWWLGNNISSQQVRNKVEIACQTAGVNFGSQLTLIER